MKGEELTNRVLLFALGKTTALPLEGANLAEFPRFQCPFFKQKYSDLINKPISNIFFSSYKSRKFGIFCSVPP